MRGADRALPEGLTARALVRDMGPALLRLVAEGPKADDPLSAVTIHAPAEPGELEPGAVVLGVGVTTDRELLELSAAMTRAGAGVLAMKGPVPGAAKECAVTVIEVNPEASWMHVAATIREYLLDYARAQIRPDGGTGDLFRLANTISASIGGPVTIEDRSSALLAWSAGQDKADSSRVETILGRAVQHRWLTALRERGAFDRLHNSTDPVYLDSIAPGQLPRVAIAVRAGSDILGYVWAAVPGPPGEDRLRELRRFAPVVALHLSTIRAETTHARHERRELAAAVLGGSADRAGASRLRLGTGPVCVLAAAARATWDTGHDAGLRAGPGVGPGTGPDAGTDATEAAELRRFEDSMALYLAAVHPRSVTVANTGAVYALVGWPAGTAAPLDSSCRLARDFLGRSPQTGNYVVAVGGPAESVEQVARVRPRVDAALRALRHPACHGPAVRTVADAMLPILLLQLVDATDSLGLPDATGALGRLRRHDGAEGVLTATLAAYLAAAGVTEVAADALRIHVNTMRYRLRRIREVAGLDFADADAVLLAQLQLRVHALRAGGG